MIRSVWDMFAFMNVKSNVEQLPIFSFNNFAARKGRKLGFENIISNKHSIPQNIVTLTVSFCLPNLSVLILNFIGIDL
jgi:hypothetical protein